MIPIAKVIVSPTEPTGKNRKKVWMQKGKNLFNANSNNLSYYVRSTTTESYKINNSNSISVSASNCTWSRLKLTISNLLPNTKYTISTNVTNASGHRAGLLIDDGINNVSNISANTNFISKISFTTDSEGKIQIQMFSNHSATALSETVIFENIQLEQGSTATDYEDYIEPKIYIKNKNDVYEKFM